MLGLLLGSVGSDLETGQQRFTLGLAELDDGVELIALALGLFGIAEFMSSVNQTGSINTQYAKVRLRDMRPTKEDMKRSVGPMIRGTLVGSLCSLIPGTGPTFSPTRRPGLWGKGAICSASARTARRYPWRSG